MIYTDASVEGRGASYGNTPNGGAWFPNEKRLHINVLELKAIFLVLKAFIKTKNKLVKIMCDNTTAIFCINKMGTSRSMDCQLTAHIPWKQNIIVDRESRVCHVNLEWMLSPRYLH